MIEKAYKLIGLPEEVLLEKLSEWICEALKDEKEKIFYFSLPFWDYTKNHWTPNTRVCFNIDKETNTDFIQKKTPTTPRSEQHSLYFKDEDGWRKYASRNDEFFSTYDTFFQNALEQSDHFSFVSFLTQKVKEFIPILTIETDNNNKSTNTFNWDATRKKLFFSVCNANIEDWESASIDNALVLLNDNITLTEEDKKKELIRFCKFLRVYQDSFDKHLFIYLITSQLFTNTKGESIESGGIVLVCATEIKEEKLKLLSVVSNLCYRELGAKNWQDKCTKESIKSAIAAIMSRNLSHNLGSHYLYYTKKHLAELADNFDENGPDIRGAAQVLGYIQARMDYLATIVAGEKYPYGSVYFKGQIFDELTIDDFSARHFKGFDYQTRKNRIYKRTTNYLLQNLVQSENFTRPPVLSLGERPVNQNEEESKDNKSKDNNRQVKLRVLLDGTEFTGASDDTTEENEMTTKLALSKLCIALPGGIMSVHAFFNVVENMIRNSAKYLKEDFAANTCLVITIDIKKSKETIWNADTIPSYMFTIYDNKNNALKKLEYDTDGNGQSKAQTLLELMNDKIRHLSILTNENELEKSDKGLKEILFSTLWMRAYTYEKSMKMSDVLFEIESKRGDDKLQEIKEHAFEYVAVDYKGNEGTKEKPLKEGNLGIRFKLPQYRMMKVIDNEDFSKEYLKKTALNSFTDIVCVHTEPTEEMKRVFPRIYHDKKNEISNDSENDVSFAVKALKTVLKARFGIDFDDLKLTVGDRSENKGKQAIWFVGHLENKSEEEREQILCDCSYCESISGANFTKTIETIFNEGTSVEGDYKDDYCEYFGLKVKEAALTRITLIDERFCKNMNRSSLEKVLMSAKNVRLLNLKPKDSVNDNLKDVLGIFDGNSFNDISESKDKTHFLSIHLGMIEKIVDDNDYVKVLGLDERNTDRKDIKDTNGKRAIALMEKLKEMFKPEFITVHSGRGNFSKDLEGPLKDYQFISVSALESVLTNSKFLLAQLFYNSVYIGKGEANE